MRVLHFYKACIPESFGGVEQVIHQIAAGSAHLGFDVDVLSITSGTKSKVDYINGYRLHREPITFELASSPFSFGAYKKFIKLANTADLIHYHFPWPIMDVLHLSHMKEKPTVLTYHSDIVRQKFLFQFYRPLAERFLGDVSRIVATSQNYLNSSKVLLKFENKVEVIPIGISEETYSKPNQRLLDHWRSKIGDKFFLFVGVLRYYKGLQYLLRAAKKTRLPVVIIGNGEYYEELESILEANSIDNVIFLGALADDDRNAVLALCYAFVLPSHLRSEAFGVSLLEAAMFGKPMISCDIGTGTTFINLDMETGLAVPPQDADALAQSMTFLATNPLLARKMGLMARRRYLKYFTAKAMVENYIDLYRRITGNG